MRKRRKFIVTLVLLLLIAGTAADFATWWQKDGLSPSTQAVIEQPVIGTSPLQPPSSSDGTSVLLKDGPERDAFLKKLADQLEVSELRARDLPCDALSVQFKAQPQ